MNLCLETVRADGIDPAGFCDPVSVGDLQASRCRQVPREPGVYLILRPATTTPHFLARSDAGRFKDRDPTVSLAVLEENWVPGASIVYIGKAGGRRGLYQRLKQYMDFGAGEPVGHRGGRYIWQLSDHKELLVCWRAVLDRPARDVERELIADFYGVYGSRPFANLVH